MSDQPSTQYSSNHQYPLLDKIDNPDDLKLIPEDQLTQVANEVRQYLIDSISGVGGHFAAGLGTVELTVALHYVYNTPADRLVWDVGHQCYPHKILTERKDRIGTIRQKDGLAPFLKRAESEFDSFGAGHSSTSISVALGMAAAFERQGLDNKAIAIIGDGSMTAGLAYEALNHGGTMDDADLLVILNDNDMSISPNVGAMNAYLTRLLSGRLYSTVKSGGKRVLEKFPSVWELAERAEQHIKGMVTPPGSLFEDLGFAYYGPIDGHDMDTLVPTLKNLKKLNGPKLLHVVTCKGKGYDLAEADPIKYHGVTPFNPSIGIVSGQSSKPASPTYSAVFGQWLCDMAAQDAKLAGITPAMREGSGMVKFAETYSDQYYDVGIAEQHSVTFAAGLAVEGLKPVVAIYSTFLQRAYDQVVHDVAIQDLPVLFAIDRAGLVGPDGPTHAGSYDYTFLRSLPNMTVMAPADENECRQMLYTGYQLNSPAAVRYPRGKGPGVNIESNMTALPIGKADIRRQSTIKNTQKVALLCFGTVLSDCLTVADELDATLVNMRFVKPLDTEIVDQIAHQHDVLITVEENVIAGGAGVSVHEYLSEKGTVKSILHIGLPDRFIDHGSREEMLTDAGLDAVGITRQIDQYLQTIGWNTQSAAS